MLETSHCLTITIVSSNPAKARPSRPGRAINACTDELKTTSKNTANLRSLKLFMRLVDWRSIRMKSQGCTLCGHSVIIKFSENEHAVRCIKCRANPAAMCMAAVLEKIEPDLGDLHVYELSSRGPFFRFLQTRCRQFTFSEFFEDVPPGGSKNGVPCQDVQRLTYDGQSFDLCTSTDVFEHVPDDGKAFREMYRVLKPGGHLVFTVPMAGVPGTVERARLVEGRIEHILPPEYHHDHLAGLDKVLCFRNYGSDIVDRLENAGFSTARIVPPGPETYWGYGRPIVVARR